MRPATDSPSNAPVADEKPGGTAHFPPAGSHRLRPGPGPVRSARTASLEGPVNPRQQSKGIIVRDDTTTVADLIKLMDDFVAERRWEPFHDPKNLSCSIAIEAAELMEHFQWLRTDQLDAVRDDPKAMAQIREELADILAYVVSFASTMGIDLSSAMADKMKKNAVKYPAETYRGRFKVE
jgi:NTP pyrophosphatase (non-canonical NTP hydrolase)